MRFIPSSLSGRLLAAAALFVALAILVAGIAITAILGHFVRGQVDSRLDGQIAAVADALRAAPDGRLELAARPDGPPFDRRDRGWFWQASSGTDAVSSASLGSERLEVLSGQLPHPPPGRFPDHGPADPGRPRPAKVRGPHGAVLLGRLSERVIGGVPVQIVAAAPREAYSGPLRDALLPLLLAMILLGVVLLLALLFQVRLGLRPLGRLREAVAAVRTGARDRLPTENQPAEVAPLVGEINSLLDRNEAGLERARRHVANLAHGLKTPLATLSVVLAEPGRDPDRALSPLVGTMERLIRHHLARARSAALGGASRQRTDLVPRLRDLALAMEKIHAPRPIRFELAGATTFPVACDAQDCDELFGNLLDNAFRHASTLVRVSLGMEEGHGRVVVEDDGPGLPEDGMAQALHPGRRLDETHPGYGFGMPIAAEIAELYGGDLQLGSSDLDGLRVTVLLPL